MLKMFEFHCNTCNTDFESLEETRDVKPECPTCHVSDTHAILSAGVQLTTIQVTHKNSKRLKAGHVHKFVNRPAEKISVTVPAKLDKG
jgi:putative FmdB family regulatory protein